MIYPFGVLKSTLDVLEEFLRYSYMAYNLKSWASFSVSNHRINSSSPPFFSRI